MHPIIEFRKVSVRFGAKDVLRSLSFRIMPKENAAILGPNGSGKSTLIRTINREHYPLAGEDSFVRVFGKETWDVSELRHLLGIVSNSLQAEMTRDITAEEMILSGFFSSIGLFTNHRVTPEMRRKTAGIMRFLEINGLAKRNLDEMSSGEAHRVMIGRALVHKPKALLLDEPSNSLDLRAAHSFRGMLRRITKAGTSLIIVTHNVLDVIPEIGRIILLKDGRVYKDGPKDSILTANTLAAFFSTKLDVLKKDGFYHVF